MSNCQLNAGTIHSWQDDRGFGFIEPAQWGTTSLFALPADLLVCLAVAGLNLAA